LKNWWGIAFGVVCGLFGAGILLLLTRQPQGEAVQLLPPPSPPPCVVHVTGGVLHPGIYTLPDGARVGEALEAAGGAMESADLELLNLAAPIQDGERIWVPVRSESPSVLTTPSETAMPQLAPAGLVNINSANQPELEGLPGIGPALAQAILQYRQEHGLFAEIAELIEVPGIGPGILEQIQELITVGEGAPD
jgi:competence protein ComEA